MSAVNANKTNQYSSLAVFLFNLFYGPKGKLKYWKSTTATLNIAYFSVIVKPSQERIVPKA